MFTTVNSRFDAKNKRLSSHEKIWRKLKCILLNERSQSERATNYMTLRKGHNNEDSKKIICQQDWVRGEG